MAKPYDATMRHLIELDPTAWLEFLGIPVPDRARVRVIDSNLSTVTAESDKLIRVEGPEPFLFHPEFLSARAVGYPEHVLWYNVLARWKFKVPVHSVLVLLRRAADGDDLNGEYEADVPGFGRNLWFAYEVVRVWELPPERLLAAGLPLLPLAPVSRVPAERLPGVLAAVAERLRDEAGPELKATLWAATEILLGLSHPRGRIEDLTREITAMILGIRGIEESSVYQDIFAKGEAKGRAEGEAKGRAEGEVQGEARGRAEEARKILLALGRRKFGEPGEPILARLAAIGDAEDLDALLIRILDAASWEELLNTPGS